MRGEDAQQHAMFSYVSPEERVLANHPLRTIRQITDRILKGLSSFQKIDEAGESAGRGEDDDPSNPTVDFYGEMRRNETHGATTDPGARRGWKGPGKAAKLSSSGHVLRKKRSGRVADVEVLPADGAAERDAALIMVASIAGDPPLTVGADKAEDTKEFVAAIRRLKATPHVAQNQKRRKSAIDSRGDPTAGLCHQPAEAEAGGGDFGLDADGGREEEAPAPGDSVGGLDVHFGCGDSQSGAHPQPDRSDDVTAGEKCVCQRKKLRSLLAQSHDQASEASN
jgi:hypothetical protein